MPLFRWFNYVRVRKVDHQPLQLYLHRCLKLMAYYRFGCFADAYCRTHRPDALKAAGVWQQFRLYTLLVLIELPNCGFLAFLDEKSSILFLHISQQCLPDYTRILHYAIPLSL